jgi:hypothetical protein
MKSIRRISLFNLLMLVIGVMGASAIPAHAQSATGTFALAHKARWGDVLLPAGNYAFSVESETWPARVTVRQASGSVVAMVFPNMISEEKLTKTSSLVLHEESGELVVSALHLGTLGLALEFASPKLALPAAETAKLGPMGGLQPTK